MEEKKIILSGITFRYEDLEITYEVMENIEDFLLDLENSPDGIYDNFFMYKDGDNLIIY